MLPVPDLEPEFSSQLQEILLASVPPLCRELPATHKPHSSIWEMIHIEEATPVFVVVTEPIWNFVFHFSQVLFGFI